MPNMNVLYSRGNYALQTLCGEVSGLWGVPSRPYEFVTGYRAADNFTGHNADVNGVVHGVDIFVGPGNLSNAQADILTAFLRNEGLKGGIPGHPDRLYYIIYQDRIAGDFSNWEWIGAGYGHWDHIHVSTCDLFWGDPAPISALDYDSTAPWGLSNTRPQSTNITPINPNSSAPTLEEMDIDMATPEQVAEAVWSKKITVDGEEARAMDWLVALVKEIRRVPKKDDVLTAFDGKTKARVVDILANLGPDVRAIKAVTDKQAKK